MEEALIAILLADAGVAAAVGTRVRPNAREQGGALPALVVTRAGGRPVYTMSGPAGPVESRIQVDAWARKSSEALAAKRAAVAALSGYRGTEGSVVFHGIFIEDDGSAAAPDGNGRDRQPENLKRYRIDLKVWHTGG